MKTNTAIYGPIYREVMYRLKKERASWKELGGHISFEAIVIITSLFFICNVLNWNYKVSVRLYCYI